MLKYDFLIGQNDQGGHFVSKVMTKEQEISFHFAFLRSATSRNLDHWLNWFHFRVNRSGPA